MITTTERATITVRTLIHTPVKKVWKFWTNPKHIIRWNNASADWHTPKAENDLRVGGRFLSRMEAKNGSMGFDFSGEYRKVEKYALIEYVLDDGRKVQISFVSKGRETLVTETFDAEQENSLKLQQTGWQAILNNFKRYAEATVKLESLHFEISINASIEKVYNTMINEKTYKEWTAEFNPTSHFIGSWERGAKIQFLGTDQEGKMGGMVSKIKENIPYRFISIEHLGIVQDGKEITSGVDVDDWVGSFENYSFTGNIWLTMLSVDLDANEEFKSYFSETWPRALNKLKEICEK